MPASKLRGTWKVHVSLAKIYFREYRDVCICADRMCFPRKFLLGPDVQHARNGFLYFIPLLRHLYDYRIINWR